MISIVPLDPAYLHENINSHSLSVCYFTKEEKIFNLSIAGKLHFGQQRRRE